MDASDPVCDGDRLTGDAVGGGGQRGDERFDVSTSVQFRQRCQGGVDGGEVSAKMSQSRGEAADRFGHAGGVFAVQVSHERGAQRRRNVGHALLEGERCDRWRCLSVEYAEVKENLPSTVGGAAIVSRAAPGPRLTNIARVQQLLQITVTESGQGAAGLNQQSGDDLRPDGRRDPLRESQFQRCGDELIEIRFEATVGQFVPQAREFAAYEVVVARSQPSADHQEGDERAGRAVRSQLRFERDIRPRLDLRPAPQERPSGLGVGGVAAVSSLQDHEPWRPTRGRWRT